MARRGDGSFVDGGVVLFGDAVVEVSSFLGVGGAGGGCCVFWEGATGRPNEQVKSRWVQRLKGAVELQRSTAFLAVHVGHG